MNKRIRVNGVLYEEVSPRRRGRRLVEELSGDVTGKFGQIVRRDDTVDGHHWMDSITITDRDGKALWTIGWLSASNGTPSETCVMGRNAYQNMYRNTEVAHIDHGDFKWIERLVKTTDSKLTKPWDAAAVKRLVNKIENRFQFISKGDMDPWWVKHYDGDAWRDALDGVIDPDAILFDPHDEEDLAQIYLDPDELDEYYG